MVLFRATAAFCAIHALLVAATPAPAQVPLVETVMTADPTVQLDKASFTGKTRGNTAHYLGIPFAYPPIGDRRFRLPEPLPPYEGNRKAQQFGFSCPQQPMTLPGWIDGPVTKVINRVVNNMYEIITPESEDCLTINVSMPKDAKPGDNLPVVVWIFGGGFQIGGSAMFLYDGRRIVDRSIELGMPVVYVSLNYRLTAFGFMPGKEIKKEGVGNLGLQDQRLALRWVNKYIKNFGGDPSKVTIWGESAGAISVNLHMITNGGDNEGLFRGAIMQSGGPIPVGDIEHGQKYYDAITLATGCDKSSDSLNCLRNLPYTTLKRAVDQSPNFFAYQGVVLTWLPRVDGVFLKDPPQHSVLKNEVSNVPVITGNCDDEGSLFAISASNITTTSQLHTYFKTYMLPNATDAQIDLMLRYYPDDPRAGCPFDTGLRNAFGPQFKRVAAIQGDVVLHGPRRFFVKQRGDKQPIWTFINKRLKDTPFLGAAHATDLLQSFGTRSWSRRLPQSSEFGSRLAGWLDQVTWSAYTAGIDRFLDSLNGKDVVIHAVQYATPTTQEAGRQDYIIHFVVNLDPNGKKGTGIHWPRYDNQKRLSLMFRDSSISPFRVVKDDYREAPLDFIANLSLLHPL